jgi:hypothetical protein
MRRIIMERNIIDTLAFDPGGAQIFQNYFIMRMKTEKYRGRRVEELRDLPGGFGAAQ